MNCLNKQLFEFISDSNYGKINLIDRLIYFFFKFSIEKKTVSENFSRKTK